MAFVQFSQVSLAFGDRDILKNVTINLQTGSKVALTGANGSGKSTLIKVLAGLTAPDSGERAVQKECLIAYLTQSGLTHQGCTLLEEADKAFQYGYDIYVGADYAIDLKTDAGQVGNGDFWVIDGAKVHLDGHPIRIGSVTYPAANLWKTGDHVEFNSETPTTLYINSIHNYTERSYYHAMKLTGAVSLDYSSKITKQYIGRGYNDTTGSLTVRGGNLYMDYGSYWGGTNVTITGGTLHIGANAATNNVTGVGTFFNRKATLTVEGTGALDIAAGRVEPVWCYRLNGEYQTAGDYPMGSGTLRVRRSSPNEGFIFVFW